MKTRGDGFAGFCLDTPLRDVIFLSRHSRHCCAAGKNILSVQTILPMFRRQRQTVQPSFLSRCNISRILLNHIKQQTHSCTGNRTPRSGYWVNITFQVTSHVCRPTPRPTVETAPPCQSCDKRRHRRHASEYELMCHLFGAEWRKKRHKPTPRKAVLFFAHAYLTITIGSRGRLPGHSLARLT
jgi:hypothetical protein